MLLCEPSQPGPTRITSLALDQAPPISGRLSLACFLSTGDIFVFSFSATDPSSHSQSLVYRPPRPSSETITQAAYYRPLLVTLADPLSLSIYDLSDGRVRHSQTWTTFTCYSPASLVLSCPSTAQYKLVVTFATPVFPEHWTVGATEIIVSRVDNMVQAPSGSSVSIHPFMEEVRYPSVPTLAVMSARTIRAFDVQSGWIDAAALQAMRDQWGRKILNVAAAQTDGKWVILAPGGGRRVDDNRSFRQSPTSPTFQNSRSCTGLQLYRLVLPAQSNSVSASPPKLNFVRTLHGHTSAISAVALADGRCISLGENGSIWVWDLEAGSGAEVAAADERLVSHPVNGTISFDERRIVSAIGGKVVVRRFDIWTTVTDTSPSRTSIMGTCRTRCTSALRGRLVLIIIQDCACISTYLCIDNLALRNFPPRRAQFANVLSQGSARTIKSSRYFQRSPLFLFTISFCVD